MVNNTTSNVTGYYPFPGFDPGPTWSMVVKIVFFFITIIVTIVGNVIVITIVFKNRSMRNVTNYYIVNLAVADLLIAAFSEWVTLVDHLTKDWIFGSFMCKFCFTLQGVSVICSILTLTVIAGDRYFAILHPLRARITERNTGIVVVIVWVVAILINVPIAIYSIYEEHVWDDGVYQSFCYEDLEWESSRKEDVYTMCLFILVYILPLGIMLFAYLSIGRKLWITRAPGERIESTTVTQDKLKRKVIRMLIVVVVTFALCWLPYQIFMVWEDWGPDLGIPHPIKNNIFFFCLWLGYANSALNPLIYCGFNENFRRGFIQVFSCRCWRKQKGHRHMKSFYSSQTDGKGNGKKLIRLYAGPPPIGTKKSLKNQSTVIDYSGIEIFL
ncbi:substance-P receptor-like [Ptychodera flava]|uniref:substance-P receptor-like n=1 Tax=Ptychodera flava TaxID=63121 RepID=UPI00396A5BD2